MSRIRQEIPLLHFTYLYQAGARDVLYFPYGRRLPTVNFPTVLQRDR